MFEFEIGVESLKKKSKKREEKINNMLNGNGPSESPFGGRPLPPPFGGSSPFGGANPFGQPKSNDNFNVDDLVKRIDAKIAELEEEEKREQEQQKKKSNNVSDKKEELQTQSDVVSSKPVESSKSTNVDVDFKHNVTDDQFFDDFFGDD